MKCDNGGIHQIISPACSGGEATIKLTVQYHELESDTLNLCGECAKNVARDARRHSYKVKQQKL